MPSIRIGFSTDFNLTREQVGIGTTLPSARLDVAGQILSDNSSGSGGVSTITRYDGFLGSEQRVTSNISIAQTTKGNLNSLSGEIVIEDEVTVTDDTPLTGGRLDSLTVTDKFDLPHGGTEDREDTSEKGSTRFNQDLGQLEFYTGYEWRTTNSYADSGGRGRGVIAGGYTPTSLSTIQYVTISTLGNSEYFGELTQARGRAVAVGSENRTLFGGGYNGSNQNTIDYVTIASAGNAIDFGDLLTGTGSHGGCSSSTRGIWAGGYSPSFTNVIAYVQISTIGNAVDFGDLSRATAQIRGLSSPTRGVFSEAQYNPGAGLRDNQPRTTFITISSKGDSVYFGDLIEGRRDLNACSNTTRGIFVGGATNNPSNSDTIDYFTITSTGNATDFGNLTSGRRGLFALANSTRGIFGGGTAPLTNTIDYISITTTGDAKDFGDLTTATTAVNALSDSHGGLGGF
jgi:hypothetical protein